MIVMYVEKNKDRCVAFTSLGQIRYLSCLQYCFAVVGNSSSGLIEVPSFGVPTINIGDRQKGRICADSVICCGNNVRDIETAFDKIMDPKFRGIIKNIDNPYEGQNTSEGIVATMVDYLSKEKELKKHFYDIS